MKKYILTEVADLPGDLPGLVAASVLGDRIERSLTTPNDPFKAMMLQAREAFIANQLVLLDADLTSAAGIERARCAQAEAKRYVDMVHWISEALEASGAAEEQMIAEEEDPGVEELKDQLYGSRAKPAPDE